MRHRFVFAAIVGVTASLALAFGFYHSRWLGKSDAGAASTWQLMSFSGGSQEEAFQQTKDFLATIDQACKLQTKPSSATSAPSLSRTSASSENE